LYGENCRGFALVIGGFVRIVVPPDQTILERDRDMTARIGLMGFGRIGRNVLRILHEHDGLELAAIVDTAQPEALAYLLRFDTVHGRFRRPVGVEGDNLRVGDRTIPVRSTKEPSEMDWTEFGVDYVVEATGKYRTREALQGHLDGGAKRVVLASPPSSFPDVDLLILAGVNDDRLSKEHRLLSQGSCTINAVGPMLNLVEREFGVRQAYMNSIHAFTNRMRLADVPSLDLRSSRAAAENIIPTPTYSPRVIGELIPAMRGKLEGLALNVPVPDGSCVDLTVFTERTVTKESLHECVKAAAEGPLVNLVEYSTEPIVSSDVIGNDHTAIFDSLATLVMGEHLVKMLVWYDNGWAYAKRVTETLRRLHELEGGAS